MYSIATTLPLPSPGVIASVSPFFFREKTAVNNDIELGCLYCKYSCAG
jgi:hypothetical protein